MTGLEQATVADAMHRGVITCPSDASMRTVARMMAAYRVHCIFVLYEHEETGPASLSVVSDLDLAGGLMDGGLDQQTAGELAATPVVTIRADETLDRAAQLMVEHNTAHLVVMEPGTGIPAGVLSTLDLARCAAEWNGAGVEWRERSVQR
jgi:CBS domain-containing protein